jgi:hypothetical protein
MRETDKENTKKVCVVIREKERERERDRETLHHIERKDVIK